MPVRHEIQFAFNPGVTSMPIERKIHFVCPITQLDVAQDNEDLPERWARIAGEVYSPQGMGILAHRILAHPDAAYDALLMAQFPSPAFDDWYTPPETP